MGTLAPRQFVAMRNLATEEVSMSNVPMTRRDDLLAEHLTTHHHLAFLQLADGRILYAQA